MKNTGHDFGGKSTGAGALNVWTHNLKDYVFYDTYTSGNYTGSAAKLGSGIQAYEMYAACDEYNVTCVGGEGRVSSPRPHHTFVIVLTGDCRQTVGVMGGYIQGGGHSPLSSIYGMAADQVSDFIRWNAILCCWRCSGCRGAIIGPENFVLYRPSAPSSA